MEKLIELFKMAPDLIRDQPIVAGVTCALLVLGVSYIAWLFNRRDQM